MTRSRPFKFSGFTGIETVGRAITLIACHTCGHLGALTVTRRATGKEPRFVPTKELGVPSLVV